MKLDKKLGLVIIFVVLALVYAGTATAAINFPSIEGFGDFFKGIFSYKVSRAAMRLSA